MGKMYIGTADGMKELKTEKEEVHGEQIFTSSGTFTVPEGVTHIDVFLVGGGAPGSVAWSCTSEQPTMENWNAQSGPSGRTITIRMPVKEGDKHTVIIGAGGQGTAVINNGALSTTVSNSGDTKFDDYIATGGNINAEVVNGSKWDLVGYYRHGWDINPQSYYESGKVQEYGTHAFGSYTETQYSNTISLKNSKLPTAYGDGGIGFINSNRMYWGNAGTTSFNTNYLSGKQGVVIIRW